MKQDYGFVAKDFELVVSVLLFLQYFACFSKVSLGGKTEIYFDQPQLSLNLFQFFILKGIFQILYQNKDIEDLKTLL